MGMFLKREKGLAERQQAVSEKLVALKRQIANKEAGILEAKSTLAKCLGSLALEESDANQESVKHARRALERQTDGLGDLQTMASALEQEITRLGVEKLQALVRETPEKVQAIVTDLNTLLGLAVEGLGALRKIHTGLWAGQENLRRVLQERAAALNMLGLVEPLEVPAGFGGLAGDNVPATHRYTPQIPLPNLLDKFVAEILSYELRLQDPNRGLNVAWHTRDAEGIGAVGDPGRFSGKVSQTFDPKDFQ